MSEPFDSNQPPPARAYQAAPVASPQGGGPGEFHPGSKAYVEQRFGPIADFGSRAGALIIDSLLTLIGLIPIIIGAVLLVIAGPETDESGFTIEGTGNGGLAATGGLVIFLGILTSWGIQIWNRIFRMGRTGQSVGKKVMGLKLIQDQTGQPIGAGTAFAREVLSGLVNQILFLSYLWMLWDDNRQTLADKVVHSTVIRVPKG